MFTTKAKIQEEINHLEQQVKALTVGGVPVEGYESEYDDLQQQLAVLQEQLTMAEPEQESSISPDKAPQLSRWLEEAENLTTQEQFAEALKALDEADKYAGEREERLAIVSEARRRVELARETWKKERAKRIERALADKTQPLPEEIETWIEEYRTKAPGQESQVENWLKRVSGRRSHDRAVQAAESLRPKLENMWAVCERAIKANKVVAAAEAAKKALEQVRSLQREYPTDEAVLPLVAEAETWDRRARGPASTAALTANFEYLLEEYEELKKKGHDRLPRFQAVQEAGKLRFTTGGQGQEILELKPGWESDLVPADEAIREIETLATDYARQKAEEKLELAQHQAMPSDPRRAQDLLQEARDLFVPESRREDVRWLARLKGIEEYDHITVQPAVRLRREAEKRRDAALSLPVLQAWDELNKVEENDPYTPLLDQARASLHSRLEFHVEKALERAQGLRRRRRWAEAQQTIEPFLTRTRQDERLTEWTRKLEDFIRACEQDDRDEQSILDSLDEIQKLLGQGTLRAAQEAHEKLAVLEPPTGKPDDDPAVVAARERLAAYPKIGRLRDRIDIRLNLQALLERAELAHNAATSDAELQTAIEALEEAQEVHKAHPQILALQKRLRARLLLRQAEREYGVESFASVRNKYRAVIDLGGEDADRAQERLKQMAEDEEKAQDVEQTLASAREHLREKRYRQAYELLQPLANRKPPVPQSGQVWKLFGRAKKRLIEQIELELKTFQQRGRRRLNTSSILEQVDKLTELDPKRAREWNELVARCYMQLAREATRAKDALKHWQDAQNLVTPESRWYSDIESGLREAKKKKVFTQVASLVGASEQAQGLLRGLLTTYPDDPEVRLRLADVYLRGGDLESAQMQLKTVELLLAQSTNGDTPPGLPAELARLQKRWETENRLRREQKHIQAQLKPGNPLGDFQLAKRKFLRLKKEKDYAHQSALEDWWENLVDGVIKYLEKEWAEQQERGKLPWESVWAMLKILELRKEHGWARQILRQAAQESLNLQGKVDGMLHQTAPPPGVRAEEALSKQIGEAEQLLEEAQTYQAIFQRRGGELKEFRPTDLDKSVQSIRDWRDKLKSLEARVQEARGTLSMAMRTGEKRDWERGEEIIRQIAGTFDRSAPGAEVSRHTLPLDTASFAAHPTVRLLVQDFSDAKETRKRLEGYFEELPQAWEREDFARVRSLIQELRKDDPGGQKYGLSNHPVRIRTLEKYKIDLDQLEELVTRREEQLNKLRGWTEAAWRVVSWRDLPPQHVEMPLETAADEMRPEVAETLGALQLAVQSRDFREAGRHYASLLGQIDNNGAKSPTRSESSTRPLVEMVEETIGRADFKEALELCLQALCGSRLPAKVKGVLQEEWPDLQQAVEHWNEVSGSQEGGMVSIPGYCSGDTWSLLKTRQWLDEPPLDSKDDERVLSRRGSLIVGRGMALAREIDDWIAEAQAQIEAIPETRQKFDERIQDARDNINHAGTLRRWWQKGKRQRFWQAAQDALDEAGRLCPDSPVRGELQDLLNSMR